MSKSTPLSEGTVILADEQFAGRGQQNNSWVSEPGKNLTFSILLSPTFLTPDKQFYLNKAISIAINDVLGKIIGPAVKIKWPNDIYVKNDKLGGILIENILQGSRWKHAVIGIGINVNQQSFPSPIKNVTSLYKILQGDYDLMLLLGELCTAIEVRYLQLSAGLTQRLDDEYLKQLYLLDQLNTFTVNGAEMAGKITGVDERGLLKVEFANETRLFGFKEISFKTL